MESGIDMVETLPECLSAELHQLTNARVGCDHNSSHLHIGDGDTAVMTHCNNSRELYPQSGSIEITTSFCIASIPSQWMRPKG